MHNVIINIINIISTGGPLKSRAVFVRKLYEMLKIR